MFVFVLAVGRVPFQVVVLTDYKENGNFGLQSSFHKVVKVTGFSDQKMTHDLLFELEKSGRWSVYRVCINEAVARRGSNVK